MLGLGQRRLPVKQLARDNSRQRKVLHGGHDADDGKDDHHQNDQDAARKVGVEELRENRG